MNKIGVMILTILLLLVMNSNKTFSWENEITHKSLSEYAAGVSVLDESKGNYLRQLGFIGGLDEKMKWSGTRVETKTVRQWLAEGAYKEDAGEFVDAIFGWARYFNHFHNPLETWSNWGNAGLDDYVNIPTPPFFFHLHIM